MDKTFFIKFIDETKTDSFYDSITKGHSKPEILVKHKIIHRIFDLLDWNILDTDEVLPECDVPGKGNVDYSLRDNNENLVFIEVKRLDEDLSKHEQQLLDYSFHAGVGMSILTNGFIWWFYLPKESGSWEQRKFFTIGFQDQETEEIIEKFEELLLKKNVISGKSHKTALEIYKSQKKTSIMDGRGR